jgi:hypothetical protein
VKAVRRHARFNITNESDPNAFQKVKKLVLFRSQESYKNLKYVTQILNGGGVQVWPR